MTAVTNKTYTGHLYQYTGGMEPWVSDMFSMLWINLLIRLFGLICLAFMASSTNRWVSDKIARCSHFFFSCCGICHVQAYAVPQDELNPPFRTMSKNSNRIDSVGEPMSVTTVVAPTLLNPPFRTMSKNSNQIDSMGEPMSVTTIV